MPIINLLAGSRSGRGARRSATPVALDIAADAVVALQAGDGGSVRRAVFHPLPVGLVVDGEVVDSDALAAELRALFGEHKLPRDVRVGLAHPRLMVRLVELPATIAGRDLDSAVRHLAADHLPVGLDQLVVDYRRVGGAPGSSPGGLQRVLIAAARVDGIDRLTRALDGAGLRLQGIALSGLAMVGALDHPELPGKAILYVQAGALTNVVISEDREPLLVRAASAGSESIAAGLAERSAISHEQARSQISSLGLGPAPHHGSPAPIAGEIQARISQQVREGLRRVVAEVQSSRGVYAARPDACPIGAIVLTGPMTAWPGVVEALEDDLDLPVVLAGRESWPPLDDVAVSAERLDVVVGLARASEDDRPDLRPRESADARRDSASVALVARAGCAVLAMLAAAIVYLVVISNQVSSGREQVARTSVGLAAAEREAAALKPYDDFAKATLARREAVTSVAKTRFNWDRTLTELSRVTPRGVWLTSAKGTLSPNIALEGGGGDGATDSLRRALPVPALELAGCAEREGLVPAYIDRLQTISGVTKVGFSRSERLHKSTKAPGAPAGAGDCRNGNDRIARFALVTYFKPRPAQQPAAAPPARTPQAVTPAAAASAPSDESAWRAVGGSE